MKNTRMGNQESVKKTKKQDNSVEVLYQKMGDRWFAFSYINDEVFVGSIPQSEIDNFEVKEIKAEKTSGQS